MTLQEIIVYIIIAFAFLILLVRFIRQLTGKDKGCNCKDCPNGCHNCNCSK